MNRLDTKTRAAMIRSLIDGAGIRATCRVHDVSKGAVTKLITDLGPVCAAYMDEHMRNLSCKRLQVDEIWAFCYAKAKNVPADKQGVFGYGDVWTFTAIDAQTKLVPSFLVGSRDAGCATEFMQDLAGRLVNRVQLTTDGHKMYLTSVPDAFGGEIDFAQLQKIYGGGPTDEAHRYSPPKCLGSERRRVLGDPDPRHVSTSYVERQNLTMRMGMRRFTRLTNAHSKKVENHIAALAIYFMHYNFVRPHETIRCTPAMKADVTTKLWKEADMLRLLDEAQEAGRVNSK